MCERSFHWSSAWEKVPLRHSFLHPEFFQPPITPPLCLRPAVWLQHLRVSTHCCTSPLQLSAGWGGDLRRRPEDTWPVKAGMKSFGWRRGLGAGEGQMCVHVCCVHIFMLCRLCLSRWLSSKQCRQSSGARHSGETAHTISLSGGKQPWRENQSVKSSASD